MAHVLYVVCVCLLAVVTTVTQPTKDIPLAVVHSIGCMQCICNIHYNVYVVYSAYVHVCATV